MNMARAFEETLVQLDLNKKVLVAVSTGVDSMTLVDLLLRIPIKRRPQLFIAYVDHRLREQSSLETEFIQKFCKKKSLTLFIKRWEEHDHPQRGVEAAARTVRYDFFEKIMRKEKITDLLTAHHADDQAETFLMKLVRGGELNQLIGIERQRPFRTVGRLSRPLLKFSKQAIREYAVKHHLNYFEDYTNQDNDFFRNRVRNQIIPRLKEENPRFLEHIGKYTDQLEQFISVVKENGYKKLASLETTRQCYSVKKWLSLSYNWQEITLKLLLQRQKRAYSQQQLMQIMSLLKNDQKPQGSIILGQKVIFAKQYACFFLKRQSYEADNGLLSQELKLDQWHTLPGGLKVGLFLNGKQVVEKQDDVFVFSNQACLPLKVRHRRPGDTIETKVGHQKIKKIMIDAKLTAEKRKQTWLVTSCTDQVIWVVGLKKSDLSECRSDDKIQYMVIFRRK
ncbi:tRNA lysidine(34) synthetase TilS [Liquorilactobacillus capillatus]|nr:tRNA lysidine(34) synthetase TilS [Liquorilactobacillus capillatus]